jgi:hypothetical protein
MPTNPTATLQFQTIPLTQGKVALVDAHNYAWLNQFKWYALHKHGRWYAARHVGLPNGKQATQYMHRVVMGVTDPKIQVDHKNRNSTLDNRENNLRLATHSQNQHNQGVRKQNISGFKGVSPYHGRWRTLISVNGANKYVGSYDTRAEAAQAYNAAALLCHKDFSVLNDLSKTLGDL